MSFINIEFPVCLAMGAVGGPVWNTAVAQNQGGFEQRNQVWSSSKMRYDVSTAIRSVAEYQMALDHFNEMRGRLHSFPFQDFLDYQVPQAQGYLQVISPGVYQLVKRYGSTNFFYRKITRPINAIIYRNGVVATGVSLNTATGVLTDSVGTGTLSWSGEFRVPVRYGVDQLPGQVVNNNGSQLYVQASSILLEEVRE